MLDNTIYDLSSAYQAVKFLVIFCGCWLLCSFTACGAQFGSAKVGTTSYWELLNQRQAIATMEGKRHAKLSNIRK